MFDGLLGYLLGGLGAIVLALVGFLGLSNARLRIRQESAARERAEASRLADQEAVRRIADERAKASQRPPVEPSKRTDFEGHF